MEHMLTECNMTKDAVELALAAVEKIRGETACPQVKDRLTAAFRLMGCDNSASEMKVMKVLGKLHDDIKRVLHDQRSAIQTYAAMPVMTTHAPSVAA